MLIMFLFERFGNKGIILAIIAVIALSVLISLVVIPIMRIFNKFDPLEEGELKEGLLGLCEKYGVNPHPLVVKLTYSHPTLSQRIDAITLMKKEEIK